MHHTRNKPDSEKRANPRWPFIFGARIRSGMDSEEFPGITRNYSVNGMYISTGTLLLMDPRVEIIIPLEKEILRLPARVVRIRMKGNRYEGIGVKLMNPAGRYSDPIAH